MADDAHRYLYRELDTAIPALDRSLQGVTARLALLPMAGTVDLWSTFAPIVLGDHDASCLDDLRAKQVLVAQDPPDLGHARRWEAAWTCLIEEQIQTARAELNGLARALAARHQAIEESNRPYATALSNLTEPAEQVNAHTLALGLCHSARTLFPDQKGEARHRIIQKAVRETADMDSACAPLLAKGLLNTLNDAQEQGDRTRRDALLDELRALAQNHSEPAVRERLAKGIGATMYFAGADLSAERFDALKEELRPLAAELPADHVVNQVLRGLDGES